MSTTIDQRVVEMRFDNKHFEQNVATTMSTLDKLKQKLNLSGATKGLEDINTAAKSNNMPVLGSAVEAVSAKFSALQVMGVTALANITNSAVNAGKRIVKSLTIDPIKSGFDEYETKMGSIQTILANTEHQGTTLDDVTAALDKLNTYADKTIYNFQQMTRNIGTFTAAGVYLQTSVDSIQGIANLAAVSGSTSQQASTAMYQLSHALASGTVKLQDWNSVVNAGMGGKVFQNALIRTAAMLDGSAKDVEAWQKIHIGKYGSFRESLSKEQWLTTEVLTTTLKQFTMAAEEGSDEWNEFKKSLMATGYTETQADEILKMANTATDAATKVKTFTQLMDTLKESAQSGWAQTWELLVGDFEEAKAFFTEMSDIFGEIIGKSADRRNNFLGEALTSNWDKLITKINDAGVETSKFEESIRKVVGDDKLDDIVQKFGSLEKAVRSGAVSSDVLKKALAGIGLTNADGKIASFVDGLKEIKHMLGRGNVGDDVKKLQTALKELGYDLGKWDVDGIIGPVTEKAIKAFQEANGLDIDGLVGPKTLAALEKAGAKIEKTSDNVDGLTDSFSDLIDVITEKSGRELILGSLMNVIKAVMKPAQAVGEAIRNIFDIKPTDLYNAIEALNKFTNKLIMSDESADKVRRTFEGLFAAVDIVATVLAGPFKFAFRIVTETLSRMGLSVLDVTARIGDSIVAFRDKVDEVVDTITDFIVDNVSKWIEQFKETEFFKTVAGWFEDAAEKISDSVDNISNKVANFNASGFIQTLSKIGTFLKNVAGDFADSKLGSGIIDGIVNTFTKLKEFFGNVKFPKFTFKDLATMVAGLEDGNVSSLPGFLSTFASGIKNTTFTKLKTFFKDLTSINWGDFKTLAFNKFIEFWSKTGDKIKGAFEACKTFALSIKEFIFGTQNVSVADILGLAEKFLSIIVLIKALNLLNGMVEPFDNITDALNNFAASMRWKAISATFKSMALALGVLTICIVALAQIPDINKAWHAAGMLASLLIVMGGVAIAMGWVSTKLDSGWSTAGVAFSLLAMVGAIVLLIHAIKEMDALELKDPQRTFNILAGALLAMVIGMAAISKAGGSSFKSIAAVLTMITALKLLLDVITAYDEFDWTGKSKAIRKMIDMMLALSAALAISSLGKGGSSGLALTLLAMVLSLKLLLNVIKEFAEVDEADLEKGGQAVVKLLGIMTLMAVALNLSNKSMKLEKGQKSINSFKGLAVALLAVVASIWILGKMATNDKDTLIAGGNAVGQILLAFTVMLAAVGLACGGLKTAPLITMLVGIGLLLAEIAVIIKILEDVPWQQSMGTAGALGIVLLALTGVIFTLSKIGDTLTWNDLGKIGAIFGGLLIVIAALGLVLAMMSGLDTTSALSNAGALAIVLTTMTGVIFALSKMNVTMTWGDMGKIGAMFGGLVIVLAGLGLVLAMMTNLNTDNAIANATSLSILLGVMTGVLFALSLMKVDLKSTGLAILGLAALGLVVWEIGAILGKLEQSGLSGSAIGTVGVLSAMLIVMTGVLAACTGLGVILQNPMVMAGLGVAVLALAALGLVVWEIGAIIRKLSQAGLDSSAIGAVNVISAMLITMTGVLAVCSVLGIILQNPLVMLGLTVAVVALAALGLVVWEIGAIIRKLKQNGLDESAAGTVDVLTTMLTALLDALKVLTIIGVFGVAAFAGVAILGVLALELGITIWALSKIKNTETARTNVETIILLLSSLSGMIVTIGMLGSNATTATDALVKIVHMVEQLSIFAAAIGVISNMFGDGVDKGIEKGLSILKIVANGFGEIIGSFGEGLTSSLPAIGDNLSKFGDNLGGFVAAMNNVDDDIITKAGNLAEAIMSLTKGNFLNTLASFGDGTLATLGEDLSKFAGNASDFMTAMSGIKPETATSMDAFASAVGTLNTVCGDNNLTPEALAAFGGSIEAFATCISNASISLNGITDQDVENVKKAAAAGEALAELNKQIPRTGGTWQDIAGSQDLAEWGTKISAFADSLVAYSAKVSGTTIDSEAIKSSAEAATAVSDLNAGIPKSGGAWQSFAGEQDIASWGSKIATFADGLISYSDKIAGANLDPEAISRSAEAAGALAEVNDALPKEDGWWQKAFGEKNMETFGSGLVSFAAGLVSFSDAAAQISEDDVTAIKNTGKAMDEIKLVVEKLPKTGGTASWFGERDVYGFGTGISAMAKGIKDCVTVAGSISDDEVAAISNLSSAMDEIELVFADVPEVNTEYTANFKAAVGHLKSACDSINSISTAGYDFSGLSSIKTGIKSVINIIGDVNTQGIYDKFIHLKLAIDQVSSCSKTLAGINSATYGGVDTLKGALNSLSEANVDGVIQAFSGKSESMKAAVNSLVSAMSKGLSEGSTTVSTEAGNIADAAVEAVGSKKNSFKTAGTEFITCIYNGMLKAASTLLAAGSAAGNMAANGVKSQIAAMYGAGKNLGEGLVRGINAMKSAAYSAGYALGKKAVEGEKDGQNSNSPSKDTIKAGKWIGEGLVIGMDLMGTSVYKAGRTMGEKAVGSISNSIRTISEAINSDIDAQPTIRPVLDLSDIRYGASAISDMFGNNSIGLNANVSAISSMMNSRSQNGANADVVSAIDKLNKKMDNLGNTTYQVNGVTYDDGSNIAEAVRSITRAAVRERRV